MKLQLEDVGEFHNDLGTVVAFQVIPQNTEATKY